MANFIDIQVLYLFVGLSTFLTILSYILTVKGYLGAPIFAFIGGIMMMVLFAYTTDVTVSYYIGNSTTINKYQGGNIMNYSTTNSILPNNFNIGGNNVSEEGALIKIFLLLFTLLFLLIGVLELVYGYK